MIEEVGGGKDVAPGDFAAIGDDHADDVLAFQAGCRLGETLLHLLGEFIDGAANAAFLINLGVRLSGSFKSDYIGERA